jgi:hypothetical protein
VSAAFAFDKTNGVGTVWGKISHQDGITILHDIKADKYNYAVRIQNKLLADEAWEIVLLNEADSLALWKAKLDGNEKVFLTRAGFAVEDEKIKLSSENPTNLALEVYPLKPRASIQADTIFKKINLPTLDGMVQKARIELVKLAGPVREIPLSTNKWHLAIKPNDADFTNAAVWKIKLPENLDMRLDPILRIRYIGDVARIKLDGKLLDDNFYNGREFDLGLKRYGILDGELRLEILPLRNAAPIFIEEKAKPDFGDAESLAKPLSAEIINRHEVEFIPASP